MEVPSVIPPSPPNEKGPHRGPFYLAVGGTENPPSPRYRSSEIALRRPPVLRTTAALRCPTSSLYTHRTGLHTGRRETLRHIAFDRGRRLGGRNFCFGRSERPARHGQPGRGDFEPSG